VGQTESGSRRNRDRNYQKGKGGAAKKKRTSRVEMTISRRVTKKMLLILDECRVHTSHSSHRTPTWLELVPVSVA